LVTAHDWNPASESVAGWLARELRATYVLFSGSAGASSAAVLISTGRISVIIDGLDEIAEDMRPVALQALSQQAAFRIVILSRTAEMASAASQLGILQGAAAIELQPVRPAEAVSYLERTQLDPPPEGWNELIDELRSNPTNPLSIALDKPLTLTLLRDTCQSGDDLREFLEFCNRLNEAPADQAVTEITDYLLDRALYAAYARRPGQPLPRYDLDRAHNALAMIAARMNQDGSRDLEWWTLSAWVSPKQRAIALVIAWVVKFGLAVVPIVVIAVVFAIVPVVWLISVLAVGFAFGLFYGIPTGLKGKVELGTLLIAAELPKALNADSDASSLNPVTSWRYDRNHGLISGLAVGLPFGVAVGCLFGPSGFIERILFGAASSFSLTALTWFEQSEIWAIAFFIFQMAMKWHTPVRFLKFLDDAHERNILRTVGPAYQFRHARLQDRLAADWLDMI